jgi:putative FmdB family regulatory protein
MPTYEYECRSCGHTFEAFQSIKDRPLRRCPACGKGVKRLIGTGAGIIFRGSGFYETDYRSEDYRKKAESERSSEDTAGGSSKKDSSKGGSSGNSGKSED